MEQKPRKHNLDRFQAWSRETIEANRKQRGDKANAQKEKKN